MSIYCIQQVKIEINNKFLKVIFFIVNFTYLQKLSTLSSTRLYFLHEVL